jgi:hypothetical protein
MELMEEVVPRLKATMQSVKPVGAEDPEELLQDAICVAATMLDALERRGKKVTPGNVVYYTTLHMRSGRRSYSAGRTDTMGSGTQLDGKACVLSFEEPAGIDPDSGEEIPLGDLLSAHQDDPSMTASRTIDWESFLATRNPRYAGLVCSLASGKNTMEAAKHSRRSYFSIRQLKQKLAHELREFMGERALADAMKIPAWRGNIQCDHEKALCRADRRHS